MKKFKNAARKFVVRYGTTIAAFAFAYLTVSANTSCWMPFYEPEEPNGLEGFKKFNK